MIAFNPEWIEALPTYTESELQGMTTAELLRIKASRFQAVQRSGLVDSLVLVAKHFGEDPVSRKSPDYISRHGPKREHHMTDFHIYYDGYGGYLTVKHHGTTVLSTHKTDQTFIPGEFWKLCYKRIELAEQAENRERLVREQAQKNRMMGDMSL